jgi:hypothetical protein
MPKSVLVFVAGRHALIAALLVTFTSLSAVLGKSALF